MRLILTTLFVAVVAVAAIPARDAADERPTARRLADPDRRERLQQYLAAFRRLSPEMQPVEPCW